MPERPSDRPVRTVLFLCTGNSARSVMAEGLLNAHGAGRFRAFSAGSHPTGRVNPAALRRLGAAGIDPSGFRSKSWNEFAGSGAPGIDYLFTMCDHAAGETCPIWSGAPITAHWGIPDPAAVEGSDEQVDAAFEHAFAALDARIAAFLDLPLEEMEIADIRGALERIGQADY